jgi:hypothetical protein
MANSSLDIVTDCPSLKTTIESQRKNEVNCQNKLYVPVRNSS